MPRYVVFLRAVNVGGRIVKMERLRDLFSQQGYANVETFIASGNVLFDSRARDTVKLEREIEQMLGAALGFTTATLVRPLAGLSDTCAAHAFAPIDDAHSLHVGFLRREPTPAEMDSLKQMETPSDLFEVCGKELYWLCKVRISESKITNARLGKALGGHPVTFRNITTVRKLAAKADT